MCSQPTLQKVCKVAWPDCNLDRLTVRPNDSRVPRRSSLRDIFALEFVEIFIRNASRTPSSPPDQSNVGRISTTCWISRSGTSSQTSSEGSSESRSTVGSAPASHSLPSRSILVNLQL